MQLLTPDGPHGKAISELGSATHLPEVVLVVALGNGFILTAMLWGAFIAELIDRRLKVASAYLVVLSLLSYFGIVHSVDPSGTMYLPWKLGEAARVPTALPPLVRKRDWRERLIAWWRGRVGYQRQACGRQLDGLRRASGRARGRRRTDREDRERQEEEGRIPWSSAHRTAALATRSVAAPSSRDDGARSVGRVAVGLRPGACAGRAATRAPR